MSKKTEGSRAQVPGSNRSSRLRQIVFSMIILIIIILAIFYTTFYTPEDKDEPVATNDLEDVEIIKITSVSGGSLSLQDARFVIEKGKNDIIFETSIFQAEPQFIIIGEAMIYPIPSSDAPVDDGAGSVVDSNTDIRQYSNCTLTYVDADSDEKVSLGDTIYIYTDWERDGKLEVESGYTFKIVDDSQTVRCKFTIK